MAMGKKYKMKNTNGWNIPSIFEFRLNPKRGGTKDFKQENSKNWNFFFFSFIFIIFGTFCDSLSKNISLSIKFWIISRFFLNFWLKGTPPFFWALGKEGGAGTLCVVANWIGQGGSGQGWPLRCFFGLYEMTTTKTTTTRYEDEYSRDSNLRFNNSLFNVS